MEVSGREIADALNLPIRVIEALETDDYDRLPPTVFTRGYLRSYARLLELPADELLELYPQVEPDVDSSGSEQGRSSLLDPRQLKLAGIVATALVVVALLAIWLFVGSEPSGEATIQDEEQTTEQTTEQTSEQAPEQTGEEPAIRQEAAAESDEPEPDEIQVPDQPTSQVADTEDSGTDALAVEVSPTESSPPESSPAESSPPESSSRQESVGPVAGTESFPTAAPGVRRITEFGDDLLRFSFNEECWVEVKSVTGENLYSDLNRAGRTLLLQGRGPFRILLGYAPGVELEFNGESVPLSRYTRNNVANLVLGE